MAGRGSQKHQKLNMHTIRADDFFSGHRKGVLSFIWQLISAYDRSAKGLNMEEWVVTTIKKVDAGRDLRISSPDEEESGEPNSDGAVLMQ